MTVDPLVVAQVDPSLEAIAEGVNLVWVLMCTALVFFMHCGFGMLESGQVRSKNVSNQLTKNLLSWSAGIIPYFIIGGAISTIVAGITTGGSIDGAFAYMQGSADSTYPWASFLFGGAFAMATASIVSGAIGGRAKLSGFVIFSVAVGSFIYPTAVGLTWSGGFLSELGYADFAGSGVVHMVGGVAALTAAYLIGPRIDRFNDDGSANVIPGHSVTFTVLGALILAFGWFGFNLGTALTVFGIEDGTIQLVDFAYVGRVALNTALVMGAGAAGAGFYALARGRKTDPTLLANGLLAGLVSVCAIAAVASPWGAMVVGFIAGGQVPWFYGLQERLGIDDVCAVFPVHGSAGAIGVLAYPFVDTTSAFSISQLGIQVVGVVVLAGWAALATGLIFGVLKAIGWARVSREHEVEGLDMAEHNIRTYPEFGPEARATGPDSVADGGQPKTDGGRLESDGGETE